MIRTSEKPKKRFNIERNISRQNAKTSTNNSANAVILQTNYAQELEIAKNKLETLEQEFNKLVSENSADTTVQLANLKKKIASIKSYIDELQKIQKRSLNATSVKIQNVKYSARTIRMGPFYKIKEWWQKYLLVAAIGSLVSVIIWLLVQYTGVYSAGLSGIIQGIAKITKIEMELNGSAESLANAVYNALFWGLYFIINIPLLIFGYFKVGKQFAIMTIIYIAFSQLVGFGLGFINDGNGIFIFTNMSEITVDPALEGVQILAWNADNGAIPGLFIYSVVYALIAGISYSIIYILGASSGGTDVFGFYYSKVKNKSIGTLLTYFNVASLVIGVTLGSFACWMIKAPDQLRTSNHILEAFFSPNLVASVLGSIISGLIYNYFFPRSKIVKVQIYSQKAQDIAFSLIEKDWNYKIIISQTTTDTLGGSSSNKSLETVCSYIDLPTLISNIRDVDSEGLVTIYSTFGVDGELPTTSYER